MPLPSQPGIIILFSAIKKLVRYLGYREKIKSGESLPTALTRYGQMLTQLETAVSTPLPEQVLKVLLARDAVQDALHRVECPPTSLLLQLAELDRRLQQQQARVVGVEDYPHWRNSFGPPTSSWWWHFEIEWSMPLLPGDTSTTKPCVKLSPYTAPSITLHAHALCPRSYVP
ncbi:MAG: hypothetical protein AB4426_13915, partial [Xenococcaceae cyanobacterium]